MKISMCVFLLFLFTAIADDSERPIMEIGALADCQYCDQPVRGKRHYKKSPEKLKKCVTHYNSMKLNYIVHLGDFIDKDWKSYETLLPITAQLKHPLYHVLGNHDFSVAEDKKLLVPEKLGLKSRYYDFKVENWRFIVVDGNDVSLHAWPKGSKEDLSSRELYKSKYKNKPNWNGAVGKAQLKWISEKLRTAEKAGESVVLYCHFPIFPKDPHCQ